MKTITDNSFSLDISSDCIEEYTRMAAVRNMKNVDEYLTQVFIPLIKNTLSEFAWQNNSHYLGSVRMLDAHGCIHKGTYVFSDENTIHRVEKWIKKHENNHDLLYINVCNKSLREEPSTTLQPAKCTLIYPQTSGDIVDLINQVENPTQNTVFLYLQRQN
jgi:hypothetical protein